IPQALLYNFFSALFAIVGVVITLSLRDIITDAAISYLLLLGGGTFIFVALSELVPDALGSSPPSPRSRWRRAQVNKVLSFSVGVLLLGLPLLTHQNCDA
ncbi:unnamed protein product, partial [Laminaria digitata]